MLLNEDLFENYLIEDEEVPAVETKVLTDSEIKPTGPAQGTDTEIANLIHNLLVDENQAIQGYNNAAASMVDYPELQKIMHDIAGEEFAHIGKLQKVLEIISPNAANIEKGEVESEENLADKEALIDESLNESDDSKEVYYAIHHLTTDLNRTPEVDEVISFLEKVYPELIPENTDSYQNWYELTAPKVVACLNKQSLDEAIPAKAAAAAATAAGTYVVNHWDAIMKGLKDLGIAVDELDQKIVNIKTRHKDLKQNEIQA